VPLVWRKKLSMTDALHTPSGSIRAFVPLTRSGQAIDPAWFRTTMFGDFEWVRSESGDERTTVEMNVTFNRVNEGPQAFDLSHDPQRLRHHKEATTRLRWNAPMRRLLRNNDMTGSFLILRRDISGEIALEIVEPSQTSFSLPVTERRRSTKAK
jgi:hypothetical protein